MSNPSPPSALVDRLRERTDRGPLSRTACFSALEPVRRALAREGEAELAVIGWLPEQCATIHDPGDGPGAFEVLQGSAEVVELGSGHVAPRVFRAAVGQIVSLAPGSAHQLRAVGEGPLVTLHLGAPSLDRGPRVAVIGGGASSVSLSRALAPHGLGATIVDPAEALGRGAAYDADPSCLLNVPAARMGIDADDPEAFLRWWRERDPSALPSAFAPRALYGRWLESQLEAVRPPVRSIRARVVGLLPRGPRWELELAGGARWLADAAVLATGNPSARLPPGSADDLRGDPRIVSDPWRPGALDGVGPSDDLLLLGTGLTALDALSVLRERGHSGRILAVSRHGRLPLPHRLDASPGGTLTLGGPPDLVRWLRECRAASEQRPWQTVIDDVRARAGWLWSSLPQRERARFLRHLRPMWEIHRHRAPVPALEAVEALRAEGRLQIRRGHLLRTRADGPELEVWIQETGHSGPTALRARHLVIVTGPDHPDPLSRALIARGVAICDPSGLGIATDPDGAVLDPGGRPLSGLFGLGPVQRPALWDITAIPEIRRHAASLAERLARLQPQADRRLGADRVEAAPSSG